MARMLYNTFSEGTVIDVAVDLYLPSSRQAHAQRLHNADSPQTPLFARVVLGHAARLCTVGRRLLVKPRPLPFPQH